jgi:cardiolipin synthase
MLRRKVLRLLRRTSVPTKISFLKLSLIDPFRLRLALEANVVVDEENFAKKLKHSLEQAIKIGARRILQNHWKTRPIRLRLASWLSYGLVRFMVGMTGYAPGKESGQR